jgi:hypothetical protein
MHRPSTPPRTVPAPGSGTAAAPGSRRLAAQRQTAPRRACRARRLSARGGGGGVRAGRRLKRGAHGIQLLGAADASAPCCGAGGGFGFKLDGGCTRAGARKTGSSHTASSAAAQRVQTPAERSLRGGTRPPPPPLTLAPTHIPTVYSLPPSSLTEFAGPGRDRPGDTGDRQRLARHRGRRARLRGARRAVPAARVMEGLRGGPHAARKHRAAHAGDAVVAPRAPPARAER